MIPREIHGIDLMNARVNGEQLGLKKGEQIGVKKALLRVARNLKASGSPTEFIAKQTGLTLEEINDL